MDALLMLRCLNLQRGIDELGSADVFLRKYSQLFGEGKALSSNHLFKFLSGKIPIREVTAREFEMVLQKQTKWLDHAHDRGTSEPSFGAWPHATTGSSYAHLPGQAQQQLKADADALVDQWSSTDWRHVRVIASDK